MTTDNLEVIVERREISPERDVVIKQLGVDFIDQGINRGFFGWIRARIDNYLDSESRTLAAREAEFFDNYATTYATLFGNGDHLGSLRSMDQTKVADTPQANAFSGLSQKHRDAIIIDKITNVLENTGDQFVAGLFRIYLSHDLMCSDAVHQLIMGYESGQEFSWRAKPPREITLHQEGEYVNNVICRSEETKRLTRAYPIEDTFGETREYFATCNRAMELARHYMSSPARCIQTEMSVLAPLAAIAARDGEWRGIELEYQGGCVDFQQHLDGNMLGRLGGGIKRLQEANIVDLQYHQDKVYLLPTEGFIQLTRERLGR